MSTVLRPILLSLFLGTLASCGIEEPEDSHEKFLTGAGPTRGHEDITRFGVEFANFKLSQSSGGRPFPDIQHGVSALTSNDPLVRGNYETDFPTDKMRAFNLVSPSADWHNDTELQFLHSLRGTLNGQYRSTRNTCLFQQQKIKTISRAAIEQFRAGNRNEGLYWLGHATHIIQDSFSEAHTARGGDAGRTIRDFCIYGGDVPGICHHEAVDPRDAVWHEGISCLADPTNRSWECLKDNARWAAEATGGYLTAMGRLAFEGQTDLDGIMGSYFTDPNTPGSGYFNCANIPDRKVGISELEIMSSGSPADRCHGTWKSGGNDMNDGAGGKYLELCFKSGESAAPIDSVSIVTGRNASCSAGQERIDQDLNEGAKGEYIYLCVGRGQGIPLQDLKITSSKSKGNRCGGGWNWIDADLNKGASGKYVYLCYK